jgi:two-component system response regulator NreC
VSAKKQIIKVLVADDHPVVRKGLQTFLSRQGHLRIVGEAADGDDALRKARALSPDVVLMDISMPGMNGLAVTEVLRKEAPEMKVLVLSVHTNKDYIFRVIQAGAHGYVSKEAPPEELLRAIESVAAGEPHFSEDIARAALNEFVSSGGKKEPFAQLTSREREVLVQIAEGKSNKEIADRLGIGVRTIETGAHHAPAEHPFGGRADQVRNCQRADLTGRRACEGQRSAGPEPLSQALRPPPAKA